MAYNEKGYPLAGGAIVGNTKALSDSLFGNDRSNYGGNNYSGGVKDFDEYYNQAEDILSPKFKEQMENLSAKQVNRGFYGQMPADVMQQELANKQTAQKTQYAQRLKQQDWENQMQQKQFELQKKQYNEQMQERENQSTMSSMGTGASIGASVGGPVGAVVGGGLGWLADSLF